jgi:ribosome assembly protein RRB1
MESHIKKSNKKEDNKINLNSNKKILENEEEVETTQKHRGKSKTKDDKLNEGKGKTKKRARDEDAFIDNRLSKNFNKMDFSEEGNKTQTKTPTQNLEDSEDSEYMSESDENEEVLIDEDHDDLSEEYMEDEDISKGVDKNKGKKKVVIEESDEDEDEEEGENSKVTKKVTIWDEKNNKLSEDQELDFDNAAYEMLHRAKVEWPCMSIDFILPEKCSPMLSENVSLDTYPYSCIMVGGAQTNTKNGFIYCMKWANMHKTKYDDDPDKGAESDSEDGEEPVMRYEKVPSRGNINRIKAMRGSNNIVAYWSDLGSVEIANLNEMLAELEYSSNMNKENSTNTNKKRKMNSKNISLKSFNRSKEGFAIEWSHLNKGVLAAGGYDNMVEVYIPKDEAFSDWINPNVDVNSLDFVTSLKGHKGSVEDVIWSPHQQHVLASCSIDSSIRFWDLRKQNKGCIKIDKAHESDVNCISWNYFQDFMVASGGDDCSFKVWDIRHHDAGPIANIKWHKGAITAIQWDPFEDSQLSVSSEDNRLSVWDFAVEPDDQHLFDSANVEIPQQLIFLHQGQENIKDLKFHPVFRNFIVSTAENGINVFKPAFDDDSSIDSDDGNPDMYD